MEKRSLRLAVGGFLGTVLVLTIVLAMRFSQPSSLGRIFLP